MSSAQVSSALCMRRRGWRSGVWLVDQHVDFTLCVRGRFSASQAARGGFRKSRTHVDRARAHARLPPRTYFARVSCTISANYSISLLAKRREIHTERAFCEAS